MTRLRQPGDSDYDVLGVLPGATDEEINLAFRQLIDGQGYKVGIPLNRHWLRAHQIKTAHATLADPDKRRAYDGSLSQASDSAAWAFTAIDTATDELILPEIEPAAAEPVENQSTRDPVIPPGQAEWAPGRDALVAQWRAALRMRGDVVEITPRP